MNPTGLGGVRSQTGMHKVHSLQLSLTVTFFLFFYRLSAGRPFRYRTASPHLPHQRLGQLCAMPTPWTIHAAHMGLLLAIGTAVVWASLALESNLKASARDMAQLARDMKARDKTMAQLARDMKARDKTQEMEEGRRYRWDHVTIHVPCPRRRSWWRTSSLRRQSSFTTSKKAGHAIELLVRD